MTPWKNPRERVWKIDVPRQGGGRVVRSTGTTHKPTAEAMARMIQDLGRWGKRDWEIVNAVVDRRLTLGQVFDAYRLGRLADLRVTLGDIDLGGHLPGWAQWLTDRVSPGVADRYRQHLATLHRDQPWPRSTLTARAVDTWLAGLRVTSSTKRKYLAALASFLGYLDAIHVDYGTPLAKVKRPKAGRPRTVFLELPDVHRVVEASPEPYRTLFALLYGTGLDLSTALRLTRRDVQGREIRGRGTKTQARDRMVLVAEWAGPYVEALVADRLPDAPLFPGVNRWTASDVHRETLERLGLRELHGHKVRLHDARHHWAVLRARAGVPLEIIARQLGHTDPTMVLRTYGRFVPSVEDRRQWDAVTAQDAAKRGAQ
jgi:integrase